MANDLANEAAIGFDTTGVYLELRSHDVLSSVVLPKYFKTGSVTSFVRQLHNYGFRTKHLCERITKRKSSSAVAKPAQESEYSSSGEEDNSSYNELIRINAQLTQENLNLWQRVKLLETQLIVEPVATAAAAAAPTLAAPPLFSPIVRSSPESGALCDDLEWFSSEFL
ncbi:hypothetical protein BASA81_000981 [Batrachochytrium salamandrivorans]|nr:hypothetical protein BASA81_000981 [Batrachochytrium salamandrivorans]